MKITAIVAIFALMAGAGAGAEEPVAHADASGFASIVSEKRLGPAIGNGTNPFRAAFDEKHNRLWVLNRTPQSVSVVDLNTRSVVGMVRLHTPEIPVFTGWFNSDPYIWIGYDSQSDRVLVSGNSDFRTSVVVSIDAGQMKIATVRTFKDRFFYHWAVDSKHGELIAAGMGLTRDWLPVVTLNAKTLETRGEFTITRRVQAMAASAKTGALYTVEPSSPDTGPYKRGGPYSATRVYLRDAGTGKILSQSSSDCAYPRFLFADDRRNRLYLVYRSTQPHLISSEVNTVDVLQQGDLKHLRTLHYLDSDPYARQGLLTWSHAVLDIGGNRLLVDRNNGNLASLPLSGEAKAARFPLAVSLYSGYHLAGVSERSGEPVVLIDNAVRLLNSRTLLSKDPILLGATVQSLFLDVKGHRLLAQVDRSVHEFLMLHGDTEVRLYKSKLSPRMRLLAVDFDRQLIYMVNNDGWGNAQNLQAVDFGGYPAQGGYAADGEFSALILTESRERTYRLLFPGFPESTNAWPQRSIDLVVKGSVVSRTPVAQDRSMMPPSQLLRSKEHLYLVNGLSMTVYSAADLSVVRMVPLSSLSSDSKAPRLPGAFAVDAAGEYAYYADPVGRRVVKLNLEDGSIVSSRKLTFPPEMPLVDGDAMRLYLVDNEGGRVVAIGLF